MTPENCYDYNQDVGCGCRICDMAYPKDPAVLKILRCSKFTLRTKFTIA